jgi:hypothetical protein
MIMIPWTKLDSWDKQHIMNFEQQNKCHVKWYSLIFFKRNRLIILGHSNQTSVFSLSWTYDCFGAMQTSTFVIDIHRLDN